jgi:hypothetical protein
MLDIALHLSNINMGLMPKKLYKSMTIAISNLDLMVKKQMASK